MLKIMRQTQSATLIRVKLHGRFIGEYVPELEKAPTENGCMGVKVTFDLRNFTLVDRTAMEFLSGAELRKIRIGHTPTCVCAGSNRKHNGFSRASY
jgi:hypothetical protein